MTPHQLRAALDERLDEDARAWVESALERVRGEPAAIRTVFPSAGRSVGRNPVAESRDGDPAPWTADDAARALLLCAAPPEEVPALHRYGDADEQRAIVRSLHLLEPVDGARDMVLAAARSNDPRLIRVALGPFGMRVLDDDEVAQIALKLTFNGVPLTCVDGLGERATPHLARMLASYALERIAAGRVVPSDIWPFVEPFADTDDIAGVLAAIEDERHHPVAERRAAAEAAVRARGEAGHVQATRSERA